MTTASGPVNHLPMFDPLSKAAYDAALTEHRDQIEPALRRLEAAIESTANGNADPENVAVLRTMRVLLLSGLFDAQFYLKKYPDIRATKDDPLEHYVWHGDKEGRWPNAAFSPSFYRRELLTSVPAEQNALEHYVKEGERSGAKPSSAFDPRAYLAANPGLCEFVDRPLFHYLTIGRPARIRGPGSDEPGRDLSNVAQREMGDVVLDELVCEPLLDRLRAESPSRIKRVEIGGDRVEIARVPHMLYLPDRRLQIFRGCIVPREAVLDDEALPSLKENRATLHYRSSEFRYVDDEVCILSNVFSHVFYHWVEELYKVVILERCGFAGRYIVSRLPSFATEFLDLLGIARERIELDVAGPTVFRSALLTTYVCHIEAVAHRGVFFAMRDAVLAADISKEPSLGRRLWLDRGQHVTQKREVINPREVQACVGRHGFITVDMGALSVRAQLAAIRNAEVIGGPHGSALIHSIFLNERSTVIECFSPHFISPCVFDICRNMNHRYFQIVSTNSDSRPHPPGRDVEIDCSHLELVFQRLDPSGLSTAPSEASDSLSGSPSYSPAEPDPLSQQAYETALSEHCARIAPELRRIDDAIEAAARTEGGAAAANRLRTMRVLLCSGLFDPDYYLQTNDDVRHAERDPLEHYVVHGDWEGKRPNRIFWPWYYRRAAMGSNFEQNALQHYVEEGERAGRMPNWPFDPRAYLAANPALSGFVDKPLFHYLKIGRAAGLKTVGATPRRVEDPTPGGTIAAKAPNVPRSNPAAPPIVELFDPLSKAAYDGALLEHRDQIEPALRRLEAAIESAANGNADPAEVARLRTMRVLLLSGLFDAQFYLEKYADIHDAKVDPLDHYVRDGDREGRTPNPAFLPSYYRREFMIGVPAERNALEQYITEGERSGAKPNSAFDPQAYLAGNPGLAEFVDRPLFHYLKIGQKAGYGIYGVPAAVMLPALEYVDALAVGGLDEQDLLMRAKRALVDGLGVAPGFALYKQLIERPDHAEIHCKRLVNLRDAARNRLGAFRDTAPAGEPFLIPSPKMIGKGDRRPVIGDMRSMFVACLIDARVRSRSYVIEVDDMAILDYEGEELTRVDQQLEFDPPVFEATPEAVWIMAPKGEAAELNIAEAFSLLGFYADQFGHWMLEHLPRYLAASLSGALPRVPVLIEAEMPKTHRQALELMVPDGVEIIELPPFATARVRRLWYAPSPKYCRVGELYNERFKWEYFATPPGRFTPLIQEMVGRADRATARPTGADRVFLGRKSANHQLVNHAAIAAAAQARGFQIVYPERLDFAEQVRLLRHARFVVGPSGSAMYLAFFARPETKLCLLTYVEDVLATQAEMTGVFNAIGLDVTVLTGACTRRDNSYPWNSDFEIEEEAFCRFLDIWLNSQAASGPEPLTGPGSEAPQ
jgi:capsular polysaccharide biosynthesis protein